MVDNQNLVLNLEQSNENSSLIGDKSNNLSKLMKNGIKVPPGLIVTTKAFDFFINTLPCRDEINGLFSEDLSIKEILTKSKTIEYQILNAKIPKILIESIEEKMFQFINYHSKDIAFAIRSSANVEDTEQFSFAGQGNSYLNQKDFEDVKDSLKKCWVSLFSPSASLYIYKMWKKGYLKSLSNVKMAVIIQKMLYPDISGILFTANILNNSRMEMLINSTWGFCDIIINNTVNPDTYIVKKQDLSTIQKMLGKKERISLSIHNGKGMKIEETSPNLRTKFSLSDAQLKKLGQLGLKIEKLFNSSQDIEWAFQKGKIFILQSRAITTLN